MYGTLIDNTLRPAPRAFMLHGAMVTNPKAEHFAALNEEREKNGLPPYLPIVDERPATDAAHYAVATGWTRDGETWRRVYEVRAYPPPPPRRWTRLAIKGVDRLRLHRGGVRRCGGMGRAPRRGRERARQDPRGDRRVPREDPT